MGGNALQSGSVRLPAARYHAVERDLVQALAQRFPGRRIEAILAYADKPDFGDLDILIEGGAGYDAQTMADALDATEVVFNGDVTSIGVALDEGVFQVDLIAIAPDAFDFAARYFGYNDFGNLVGRIARKFGTQFGHLGLRYSIRDPDNRHNLIEDVSITMDFGVALALLGYDAARYEVMRAGSQFRTLDDIFRYVISTPYANRDIYQLESRNHADRIRDAKRATYNAFLAWLDEQPAGVVPAYPWGATGTGARNEQHDNFLQTAFAQLPAFKASYDAALSAWERKKALKRQFNGVLAAEATGLSGKALGELMTRVSASFPDLAAFEDFFIEASREQAMARFAQVAAGS
jgi:hypothetical protein